MRIGEYMVFLQIEHEKDSKTIPRKKYLLRNEKCPPKNEREEAEINNVMKESHCDFNFCRPSKKERIVTNSGFWEASEN